MGRGQAWMKFNNILTIEWLKWKVLRMPTVPAPLNGAATIQKLFSNLCTIVCLNKFRPCAYSKTNNMPFKWVGLQFKSDLWWRGYGIHVAVGHASQNFNRLGIRGPYYDWKILFCLFLNTLQKWEHSLKGFFYNFRAQSSTWKTSHCQRHG